MVLQRTLEAAVEKTRRVDIIDFMAPEEESKGRPLPAVAHPWQAPPVYAARKRSETMASDKRVDDELDDEVLDAGFNPKEYDTMLELERLESLEEEMIGPGRHQPGRHPPARRQAPAPRAGRGAGVSISWRVLGERRQ